MMVLVDWGVRTLVMVGGAPVRMQMQVDEMADVRVAVTRRPSASCTARVARRSRKRRSWETMSIA